MSSSLLLLYIHIYIYIYIYIYIVITSGVEDLRLSSRPREIRTSRGRRLRWSRIPGSYGQFPKFHRVFIHRCKHSSLQTFIGGGVYGQFSKCHVCFCGLDPGNLKVETVRTDKQHICF